MLPGNKKKQNKTQNHHYYLMDVDMTANQKHGHATSEVDSFPRSISLNLWRKAL